MKKIVLSASLILALAVLVWLGVLVGCAQQRSATSHGGRYDELSVGGGRGGSPAASARTPPPPGTPQPGDSSVAFGRDGLLVPATEPAPGVYSLANRRVESIELSSFAASPTLQPRPGLTRVATAPVRYSPGQELWIIERAAVAEPAADAQPAPQAISDDAPGCGGLVCQLPPEVEGGEPRQVAVPLKHTAVSAEIDAYIASVRVKQEFYNPYDGKIEAVYVFPLPEDAAVCDFLMTVGDRTIRGIIREREEAQQIYRQARAVGHVASLMTQERPNIFTQKVANIEPGKQIDIDITYFHTLPYSDGWFEYHFSMVVGPRFNPPIAAGADVPGDGVGAVGRGDIGVSGQATEIQYLRPSERSGHDIAVSVTIDAGVSLEALVSPSHTIEVDRSEEEPTRATVRLASSDTVPNRDFVLRYRVAGDAPKAGLLTHADGYFTLMLVPPAELASLPRTSMEMVFVIDTSGSMSGGSIEQARAAVMHAMRKLEPGDVYQVVPFSNEPRKMASRSIEVSTKGTRPGLDFVAGLQAAGGTMMELGMREALDLPPDAERSRFVCFLTDGYIGNESDVLRAMGERLGSTRVFSIGIGSAPNRHLMESMARAGHGVAAYFNPGDSVEPIMDAFMERVTRPAMRSIEIDWAGMEVTDVFPRTLPDMYVGRPVLITGRFKGEPTGPIQVRGKAGADDVTLLVSTDVAEASRPGIARIWARRAIMNIEDTAMREQQAAPATEITSLALAHNLMSAYTAFVAVDSLSKTEGSYGTTVTVPVPVPAGVRYETTVGR